MRFLRLLLSGRSARLLTAGLFAVFALGGCASWFGNSDPLHVSIAGLEPLASQGAEMRYDVKLRIQNPNSGSLSFSGVSIDLQLNGTDFASGVSNQPGAVPGYGETVVSVPVTASAFAVVNKAYSVAGSDTPPGEYPYILHGRLAGGLTGGGTRFLDQGVLSLPRSGPGMAGQ